MLPPDYVIGRVIMQLEDAREYQDVFGINFYKSIKHSTDLLNVFYQSSNLHKDLISIISDGLEKTLKSKKYKPARSQVNALIYAFECLKKKEISALNLEDVAQKFVKTGILCADH